MAMPFTRWPPLSLRTPADWALMMMTAPALQAPCMAYVDDWVVVSEDEIRGAMLGMLELQGKLVEGEHGSG